MCRLISQTIYLIYRPNAARFVSFSLSFAQSKNNSLEFIQTRQFFLAACESNKIKTDCSSVVVAIAMNFSRSYSFFLFHCSDTR
jgi:hypothetical protein